MSFVNSSISFASSIYDAYIWTTSGKLQFSISPGALCSFLAIVKNNPIKNFSSSEYKSVCSNQDFLLDCSLCCPLSDCLFRWAFAISSLVETRLVDSFSSLLRKVMSEKNLYHSPK